MTSAPLRIIQISDIHLFADPKQSLLGVNTEDSFKAVIELLQVEEEPIDLIILSGDLSQDGTEAAYGRIVSLLSSFNVPIYYVPGNHDNIAVMDKIFTHFPFSPEKHILLKSWQIILLNSQKPSAVEGYLDPKELQKLRQCLQSSVRHTMVILHHQPLPVGCAWLDNLGLKNAQEFWGVIGNYSQVDAIVFGHVHQSFEETKQGIKCFSAPSTCIQFKREQNEFGLENLPPGYRWIHLYEDGRFNTGIKRVPHYIGYFDANAKGY